MQLVFFPYEVSVCQEGIYFTSSKQIREDSSRPDLGGATTMPEPVGRAIIHAGGAPPDVAERDVPGGIPR